MRVLVTGSAGFIGQHLCRELRMSGHDVFEMDRARGPREDVFDWFGFTADQVRPHVAIHLAAQVGRQFGEDDVRHSVDSNAGMTAVVARECGERGIRLFYASTSEVYGDRDVYLATEDSLYDRGTAWLPHNIYGLSKRWGEEACKLYAPHGLTILRFSMPYGPGLPAGRGRAALINFLYNAKHALPIQVHRHSERSWCYIGDTVRAVRILLERSKGGAFNVGRDDNPLLMRRIAEMACEVAGASFDLIEEVDPPARQTVVKRLATTKLRDLGWEPHVEFEEGLRRTWEWVDTLPAPEEALAA